MAPKFSLLEPLKKELRNLYLNIEYPWYLVGIIEGNLPRFGGNQTIIQLVKPIIMVY